MNETNIMRALALRPFTSFLRTKGRIRTETQKTQRAYTAEGEKLSFETTRSISPIRVVAEI